MAKLTSQRHLAAFHGARAVVYRATASLLEGHPLDAEDISDLEKALKLLEQPTPWSEFLQSAHPPALKHPEKWHPDLRLMVTDLAIAAHAVSRALSKDAFHEAAEHNAAQLELLSRDLHPTVITDVEELHATDRLLLEALLWLISHDRRLLDVSGA